MSGKSVAESLPRGKRTPEHFTASRSGEMSPREKCTSRGNLRLAGPLAILLVLLGIVASERNGPKERLGSPITEIGEQGPHQAPPVELMDDEPKILIEDCARNLDIPVLFCDSRNAVDDNSYEVPYMSSGELKCGFETRMSKEKMEQLAAKYEFRFVGASTTRRLAESFVSIYTGQASPHLIAHKRVDFSSGNLKVIFDWCPVCSGALSIGSGLKRALNEHKHLADKAKRLVIITAYGIHDATQIMEYQDLDLSVIVDEDDSAAFSMYTESREQGVLAWDAYSNASLASCKQVTSELAAIAQDGSFRPQQQALWNDGRQWSLTQHAKSKMRKKGSNNAERNGNRAKLVTAHWAEGERAVTWDDRTLEATVAEAKESDATPEALEEHLGSAEGDVRRLHQRGWGLGREKVRQAVGDASGAGAGGAPKASPGRLLADSMAKEPGSGMKGRSAIDSAGKDETGLAPLVFVFQGNSFLHSDRRDQWLTELGDFQRQVLRDGVPVASAEPRREGTSKGALRKGRQEPDGEATGSPSSLYLVEDYASLFRRLECYRADDVHFLEPVKLIEAKMLWDLLALADEG